jgi:hypothetical protein
MISRLQKDIGALKKDLRSQDEEWQAAVQDQLSQTTTLYFQDIEKLLEKTLSESLGGNTSNGEF